MARVVLSRSARRALSELEWPLAEAVREALAILELDPRSGHPLRGRMRGLRSLRVGSYRIVYSLLDEERTIRVAAIRHRSQAYRSDPR